jgi:hypothetical protein
VIASMLAAAASSGAGLANQHPVFELRQYKIDAGRRDEFIELFDRELVETQEAEGMALIGQFSDRSDPDRFTWIRGFATMDARQASLAAFYSGPTWLEQRGAANPMLIDNDNVLLLRPAFAVPFQVLGERDVAGAPARLVVVTIHYLWKQPEEGFAAFFRHRYAPALERAGLPIEAALVREESPNNFPRLPVREGEKLFVWMTAVESEDAWRSALVRLAQDPQWGAIREELNNLEERAAQQLLLDPTSRSRLR